MGPWATGSSTVNPFIITPLVTTFVVILTNCDLNMYSQIPYKPLQDCDYRSKNFTKQPFYARIKVLIVSYIAYSKLYYALLDLKKVVILVCFNVMTCIEFEVLNY